MLEENLLLPGLEKQPTSGVLKPAAFSQNGGALTTTTVSWELILDMGLMRVLGC